MLVISFLLISWEIGRSGQLVSPFMLVKMQQAFCMSYTQICGCTWGQLEAITAREHIDARGWF